MARAKKSEETSTTSEMPAETSTTSEMPAETTPAATDVPTPAQEAEHAAAAADFAKGAEEAATSEDLLRKAVAEMPFDSSASYATAHEIGQPSKIVIVEESTPALEPISARASETPWVATHRVVTDDMTCLVMVIEPNAWTHPEYDSVKGQPLLHRFYDGAWYKDGEPFAGNVHSLAAPAPDRHTHRRG